METVAGDNENLKLLESYLEAVVDVNNDPYNEATAQSLQVIDGAFAETFMLFPKMGSGAKFGEVVSFRSVTCSDGIEHVRQHMAGSASDGEQETYRPDAPALARQSRGALIAVGGKIATSGALRITQLPAAYDLLTESLRGIDRDPDPDFTKFAFKRIRRDLLSEYGDSRRGSLLTPLEPVQLEANIKEAMKAIGYPYGPLGKLIVGKLSEAIVPRSKSIYE